MSINFKDALGVSADALMVRAERTRVLAANIANESTPGYTARDLDFNAVMQDRMDEVLSPTAHASLITLAQHCETLPAFRAAALSDFEKMPRSTDELKL